MAIMTYLAVTGGEFPGAEGAGEPLAWMACHFSPYTRGLSNLPRRPFPMVILNDYTPIQGHDPGLIAAQLEALEPEAVLLDLQRPGSGEAAALAEHLIQALDCPVGVTAEYAGDGSCPVFLPPPSLLEPLEDQLAPWQGREVWLEMALLRQSLTLTEQGARVEEGCSLFSPGFAQTHLHCHYHIRQEEAAVLFSLWRTEEDLADLLEEARTLDVTKAIGLWQELGKGQWTMDNCQ